LFIFIVTVGSALVEGYCFQHDIVMDEFDWYRLDNTVRGVGFAVSAAFFMVLFFILFGERLAYIRKITAGVDAIRDGHYGEQVEIAGNNELTELAEAVNYLSLSEQRIKEKEKRLNDEKEEWIRTLSHDIRTPLTSMMSYTELLAAKENLTAEEQQEYLALVSKKTAQIKELTDILLDGGRREPELFEDARLLFEQLVDEFESELEDKFKLSIQASALPAFSGRFDVGEMRRIFDNLISNIGKYAQPGEGVELAISKTEHGISIRQSNAIKKDKQSSESYKMGLSSIRRIAHHYGGLVHVSEADGRFEIIVTLSNI
jgi:signal transduction histidine kinase